MLHAGQLVGGDFGDAALEGCNGTWCARDRTWWDIHR
jgi:hypothetical protein